MKYLIYFLLACIAIIGAVGYYYKSEAEENYSKYLNARARGDSLREVASGIWMKQLELTKSIGELERDGFDKELRIKSLLSYVAAQKSQIKSLIAFTAGFEPETVRVEAVQDTAVGESVQQRKRVSFRVPIQGDTVSGYTLTDPPESLIRLYRASLAFSVSMVEMRDGGYQTFVTSNNPAIRISSITGKVIPYAENAQKSPWRALIPKPAISIGWTNKRSVTAQAGVAVWRIEPRLDIDERGLDYGVYFNVWRWGGQ